MITTESVIPSSPVEITNIDQRNQEIGIRPMGVKADELKAAYKITIIRQDNPVNQEFEFVPIYKNVPSAIWKSSERLTPGKHEEKLIKNALSGFEIRAASQPEPGQTQEIEYEQLLVDKFENCIYRWSKLNTLPMTRENVPNPKNTIQNLEEILERQINQQRRQNLLESLELNSTEQEITISKAFAEELFGDCMII